MRSHRRSGFTLVELIAAAAMVSIILLAGITASRGAIVTTNAIVARDALDSAATRVMHRVEDQLVSASLGMLEGVPPGGAAVESMQEAIDYSDLRFRAVVGFANGAVVTDPPAAAAPRRLWRSAVAPDVGTVWIDDGQGPIALLKGVTSLTFRRQGNEITLHMTLRGVAGGQVITVERETAIRLLTP